MARRPGSIERANLRGREALAALGREARIGRQDRGLSQGHVAAALGVDRSWVSRAERGRLHDVGIVAMAELLAAVGLELSARAYPAAGPVRTEAHGALLGRLRPRVHPPLGWETEVPLPGVGELRAWDAVITGRAGRCGVEAETRPTDLQALERRLALKERDGDVECVILLLLASAHNRELVRAHGDALAARFPSSGREILDRLARGQLPLASGIVLL